MAGRSLVKTWLALMGLTVLAGLFANAGGEARPDAWALVALAAVTALKARLILARYLHLDRVPAFLSGFTAAVMIVVAVVTVTFIVDLRPPVAPPSHRIGRV